MARVLGMTLDGLSFRSSGWAKLGRDERLTLNHEAGKVVHYWLCLDV
jgi:hypothetical protein